jgi:hypothetical protein
MIAMIAMTIMSSMSVKPAFFFTTVPLNRPFAFCCCSAVPRSAKKRQLISRVEPDDLCEFWKLAIRF